MKENQQLLHVLEDVIEFLKEYLDKLIKRRKGDLLHPDVISFSQFLDRLIVEYQKLTLRK